MACENIQRMRADMGGTNILSPLKWVIRQPVHRGHPRLLFVVTDGAVNNTGKVLELVRNHAFSTRWAQAEGLGHAYPGLPWTGVSRTRATWENARRRGKNLLELCFQGGVANLSPSKFRRDERPTPLHPAPNQQPRKPFLLLRL